MSTLWHAGYVQTYLERDVRNIRQIGDLTQFQSFIRTLAAQSAQLLNLADLARGLGIAVNTARSWLSVLEATYQVIVLRPYHANIGKRLVKTPKVYFTDPGTLCYLTGLRDPAHAAQGPMGGKIMETAVLSEIFKTLLHRGVEPRIYFWRTSTGSEVDIVVEADEKLVPIEVKLSSTPRPEMSLSIQAFQADLPGRSTPGYVVHPGSIRLPLGPSVTALPFSELQGYGTDGASPTRSRREGLQDLPHGDSIGVSPHRTGAREVPRAAVEPARSLRITGS